MATLAQLLRRRGRPPVSFLSASTAGRVGGLSGTIAGTQRPTLAQLLARQQIERKRREEEESDTGFFGILGNLGEDILETAKGLPAGLVLAGKSLGSDVGNVFTGDTDFSETYQNIIKPVGQSYAETYGPLFRGDVGEFLQGVGEHPLGPLLDVAAVGTLGAGATTRVGSAAARAGARAKAEGRPHLFAPDTRAGGAARTAARMLAPDPGMFGGKSRRSALGLPRNYSRSLFRNLTQRAIDPLVVTPEGTPGILGRRTLGPVLPALQGTRAGNILGAGGNIAEVSRIREARGFLRNQAARVQPEAKRATEQLMERYNFKEQMESLDDPEHWALWFAKRGLDEQRIQFRNEAGRFESIPIIDAYAKVVEDRLTGAGTANQPRELLDYFNSVIPPENPQMILAAARDPEVRANILRPTDNMRSVDHAWNSINEELLEGIPLDLKKAVAAPFYAQQALRREAVKDPGRARREYVERQVERGGEEARPLEPGYAPDILARGEFKDGRFWPEREPVLKKERQARDAESVLGERFVPTYLQENDARLLSTGASRIDRQAWYDSIARRQRDLVDKNFRDLVMNRLAYKKMDDEGNTEIPLIKEGRTNKLRAGIKDPDNWTIVYPELAVKWFRGEIDVLKEFQRIVDEAPTTPEGNIAEDVIQKAAQDLLDTDPRAFVQEFLGASRPGGVAIRNEDFHYLQELYRANEAGGIMRYLMTKWRTAVLTYMPRWWVNTAVGSFMLSLVQGSFGPRAYLQGKRLLGTGKEPVGVRLGLYGSEEINELVRTGKISRRVMSAVQRHAEDPFRAMAFLKGLNRESRAHAREAIDVLDSFNFEFKAGRLSDDAIDQVIDTPELQFLVERALDETNRFFYNFSALGPFERRVIRNFVPFWGWYKFITKLVWRLPFEYPGRTDVIQKLSEVGNEATEEEIGKLPSYLMGAIVVNKLGANKVQLLGTRGFNPFADFATPWAPEGFANGLFELGQLNPAFQAGLSAAGLDPFTGGRRQISPEFLKEHGLGLDPFGNVVDLETGEIKRGIQPAAERSFLGSVLRSIPHLREYERISTGGRPVYPDSLPIPGEIRPLPIPGGSTEPVTVPNTLGRLFGIRVTTEHPRDMRKEAKERIKLGKTIRKSQLKRVRKNVG